MSTPDRYHRAGTPSDATYTPPPPTISGERVLLRRLSADDRPRMRAILAEPEVARWWGPRGADEAADGLFGDGEVVYAITVEGAVVGAVEYSEENEPDYRYAGIDIFMDTEHQGWGLGRDAIRTMARHLFEERGHLRLTIDPAVANEHAIRAYKKIGFRPVGIMHNYERGADDAWHDGLLLDLLAGELAEAPE
jgi:aminoglycoside 6'-N-acetyltransferase